MSRSNPSLLLGPIAALLFAGCGATTIPGAATATGDVTMDGQPVAGANVVFLPATSADSAKACQASTDDQGHFQMQTHVGGGNFQPGIAPGTYSVEITKLDTASITNTQGPPKSLLPKKYGDAKTSKLTAEVGMGRENHFDFKLSAK